MVRVIDICSLIQFYLNLALAIDNDDDGNYDNVSEDGDYDKVEMAGLVKVQANDKKPLEPPKEFEVNKDTEVAAIVEATENPYYTGLNDINLEDNDINERIEGADIVEQTENPYYADVDALHLDTQVIFLVTLLADEELF